jgi:hypothetical protein
MKKLMLTFAAIAAAMVVNAATCNWSGSSVAVLSGDTATQYTMYLLDASVTDSATMASYLAKGDTSFIANATVSTTTGIAQGTNARWSKTGFGNFTAGEEYTFYTVIFNDALANADSFMITPEMTADAPSSGSLSMTFGTQTSNTWNEMAAVPEPTSGLLLLLGVAGLALRRKRA